MKTTNAVLVQTSGALGVTFTSADLCSEAQLFLGKGQEQEKANTT